MAAKFQKLNYNNGRRGSLDPHESMSYDDFRRMSDSESVAKLIHHADEHEDTKPEKENNSLPLRVALKQYSTLVWWMLAMSTAILYGGYDSVILGQANSLKAYQRDMGEPAVDFKDSKMEDVIPSIWLSLWDGIGPLGQIAGTALGGYLIDRVGRKFCLKLGGSIGAAAISILVLCNMPADKNAKRIMILVGKVIQGVGLGIIRVPTFSYLSEVVPVSLKGAVMTLVPTFTLLGQLTGAVVMYLLSNYDSSWSYMIAFSTQWALAIPPLALAFFLPESPAFLLNIKKDTAGALDSFTRLLGPKNDARAALNRMQATLEEETRRSAKTSYPDAFNSVNRRRTLIIVMANLIEIFFGLPLLSNISYFLQLLGMKSSLSLLFLIAGIIFGLVANFCSAWTVTHIGRRKLTVTTLIIIAGLWAVVGFSGIKQLSFTPWLVAGLSTTVIVVAGLGCWPTSYAIIGETSALRLRSKSQAIGMWVNSVSNIIMNFALPQIYNPDAGHLGAKTGFVFTGLSALGAVLVYFFLPELKGRSALEIDRFFEKEVKSIGSSGWRDTGDVPLKEV
jgi:SP family general alpha glucoside:H+ symporter-like MFS transporter